MRFVALLSVLMLAACATKPVYVSTSNYMGFSCANLQNELVRIDAHLNKLNGFSLETKGVGVGLSAGRWGVSPHITFGLGSSNKQTKARLLGERDAVLETAKIKQCQVSSNLKSS